jgi:translocation and assembly module TamB
MAKWQKIVGWTTVTIGALVLLVVVAAIVVLKNPAFHRYVIAKVEQTADQSTGARVEIKNLQIHIKTLTAEIYGLTVHGTEPKDAKPLLQVPHITIGLKILSVLHHQVNLSKLLIDHPVVNLVVDANGHSNLPQPPSSQKKSSTNIFDLAIGHVLLTNGVVDALDREIPLNANLSGLRTEITFSQLHQAYSGTISYQRGLIQYQHLQPLPHSLEAAFSVDPSELNLKELQVRLGGSQVRIEATVQNYSNAPVAQGRYSVVLHTQDFSGLSTANAAGDVTLTGNLGYRYVAGQSALRNATLTGDISSNGLAISSPQAVVKVQKIAGKYQLAGGNFKADGVTLNLLDGQLTTNGTVEQIDSARRSRFQMKLAGISLQALKASMRDLSKQSVPVSGTLNATADANWLGTLANLRAKSAITVHGAVTTTQAEGSHRFPLNADLHVNYDAPRNLISIASSSIQLPATSIHAQGEIGDHSNLTIMASSSDLHQLLLLAGAAPSATLQQPGARIPDIHGTATLNAAVNGTLRKPQITAQLSANNLRVNQSQWNSLRLAATANPSQISIRSASLVSSQGGTLRLNAQVGLNHWSYLPANPIAASLQIKGLHTAQIEQIANVQYPVEGELAGNIELRGSQLNPEGQGDIQISKAKVLDESLKNLSAQFHAADGTIHSTLTAGAAVANVSFTPKTKTYTFKLQTSKIDLSKSHTVQAKDLPLKGFVTISANGSGTINNPELKAEVQIEQLQLRDTSFSRVEANLDIANHLANLALNSGIGGAALHGKATVHLTPGYYTEASLDTSKFDVDPFLAMYMPSLPPGLHGETELHVSVRGPAADKSKLEAHLTIPVLDASYRALHVAASAPIRADYANAVLVIHPASIQGTDTSLQFQGTIPVNKPGAMSVSAHGSVGLRLVQLFEPNVQSGGDIALDVNAHGTLHNPGLNGQIRLENASFSSEQMPLGVQGLNANMQVSDTSIQITNGSGKLGGGDVTLGGAIIYRPQLQMNVAVSAKSVRLRYPEGMRTVFGADLTLSGDSKASLLQGRVLIDSLSFTSDFDLSSFMSQFTGGGAPSTSAGMADSVKLQIAVQSTSQLTAGTAQLGVEGTANLRIIGTAANPVVIGRADLTSGDIFFAKNQYHLERGLITFANPNQTEPVLNMLITTTINQYNLSITIRGPIQKLQTSYVSDPPLPPIDIINLIARGQTTTEGAPASFGASEVLAAGLGQVGNQVTKLTGIAGLQIDPLIGGNNTNPSARIGIQKRVTKNFTFTFSTDVTQPQSEIVQGDYQLNKRWSVSVVRDQSGGFSVDGRYHTNF